MSPLPSWLEAADPAKYYAEGARIGSSRAAQAAEQSQHNQAGQRAEAELQIRQQELEMQATRAAQKYAAQKEYQQFVAGGGDPLQAILKFGPAMGEGANVGAAVRAQQMAQPKLAPRALPAPSFQTIQGPDGTPMKVLMQNGKIVPPNQYTPRPAPAQPEQWKETTRKINGADIPGQESSRSGMFRPYPASEQAGAISPQTRMQVAAATRKKAALQKVIGDDSQLLGMAKKRAGGKTPSHADLEAVQTDLQKQMDGLDEQIDKLTSGGGAKPEAGKEAAPAAKRFKYDIESGKLVPVEATESAQ